MSIKNDKQGAERKRRFVSHLVESENKDNKEKPKDRKLSSLAYNAFAKKEETAKQSRQTSRQQPDEKQKGRRNTKEYKLNEHIKEKNEHHSKKRKKVLGGVIATATILALIAVGVVLLFPFGNRAPIVNMNLEPVVDDDVKLTLVYNGQEKSLMSSHATIEELLYSQNIVLDDDTRVSADMGDEPYDSMTLVISDKISLRVINQGIPTSVDMHHDTVMDALEIAGIEYEEWDVVVPSVDTTVTADMEIVFTDVKIEELKVVEEIPFDTQEGETSTVETGYYAVTQEGTNGIAQVTYKIKYIDGVEESREEIAREVVEEPLPKIVLWGTSKPKPSSSGSDSDSSDDGSDSGDYDSVAVSNPGEQVTNPSVPAAPSSHIEIMSGHVTAYTHTGRTTATGTWPRSTRTLDNPGSCAVVPGTIPYGSLLYVTGYGYCIAEDTGGFRHDPDRWNQIDLFMNTKSECMTWGRRRDVKVYILRKGR